MAAEPTTPSGAELHGAAVPAGSTEVPAHGAESKGLPQFQFEHWGGQIVWLLLIFLALYLALAKIFIPRLRAVLDERATTIANSVAEARSVQAEAEAQAKAGQAEVDAARTETRRRVAEAKAASAAELASRQKVEDERIAGKLAEAEARIRKTRDKAMTNVSTIAADTAQAILEKLTGDRAEKADLDAALLARTPQGNA
jgi:F-type H+-transporting ATPase subunit b